MPVFSTTLNDIKPDCFESSSNCSHLRTTYARKFETHLLHPTCKTMNKIYNKMRSSRDSSLIYSVENDASMESTILSYDFFPNRLVLERRMRTAQQRNEANKAFCFIKIAMYLNLYAKFKCLNRYMTSNIDYILGFQRLPRNFNYSRIRSAANSTFIYTFFNGKRVLFIQNLILEQIYESCFQEDIRQFWQNIVHLYNYLEGCRAPIFVEREETSQTQNVNQPLRTLQEEYTNRTEELEEEITNEQIAAMLTTYENIPDDVKKAIYDILIAIQTSAPFEDSETN